MNCAYHRYGANSARIRHEFGAICFPMLPSASQAKQGIAKFEEATDPTKPLSKEERHRHGLPRKTRKTRKTKRCSILPKVLRSLFWFFGCWCLLHPFTCNWGDLRPSLCFCRPFSRLHPWLHMKETRNGANNNALVEPGQVT